MTIDYKVYGGGGTLYMVMPLTDDARRNLEANVSDEAQWFGQHLAVEHRYIEVLVEMLREEGWNVEVGQ